MQILNFFIKDRYYKTKTFQKYILISQVVKLLNFVNFKRYKIKEIVIFNLNNY